MSRQGADEWYVYLLACGDGTLYTGMARDVGRRLGLHRRGRGARYTRGRGPLTLLWVSAPLSRGEAARREAAIKRWPRCRKLALAEGDGADDGNG